MKLDFEVLPSRCSLYAVTYLTVGCLSQGKPGLGKRGKANSKSGNTAWTVSAILSHFALPVAVTAAELLASCCIEKNV